MTATEQPSQMQVVAKARTTSATAHHTDGVEANASGSLTVLLLSTLFLMPYQVLRCAQAAGATIWVLGTDGAKSLAYSRYCEAFCAATSPINGNFDAGLADEINRHIERLGIGLVLAGDAPSTRSLIAIRDLIVAPCFPMPELTQFDFLNDKWRFTTLCKSLGIECPNTKLFIDKEQLYREIDSGNLDFPSVAKPLNMDGGFGFITLHRESARQRVSTIFYSPIVVQDFIQGEDIGASVFCKRGEVQVFIAHKYRRAKYSRFFDETIYNNIAKLMREIQVDGVFNFDMRLAPDGRVFYLECNPRFFYKIAMSMLAGVNFVSLGFPSRQKGALQNLSCPVTIRFPKAMLATLHTPRKLRGQIWPIVKFLLSDPIPYFRECLGLESELRGF